MCLGEASAGQPSQSRGGLRPGSQNTVQPCMALHRSGPEEDHFHPSSGIPTGLPAALDSEAGRQSRRRRMADW